jgi:Fur family zinc uptake transcriptional regulator
MAEHAHVHHDHGLAGPPLAAELANAERRCLRDGERLTAARRRVLELLLRAGRPEKAYDLMAAFGEAGEPAKPPTIYRALAFLERQGLCHRIESLNAFVACRAGEGGHAAAFLICDCCGATREFEAGAANEVARAGEAAGFSLRGVTIEAHGLCADCRA